MSTHKSGYSALIVAAWKCKAEVVSLLLKAGAALDLQTKVNILSLSNAMCDSDLPCVAITGLIVRWF